MKKTILVLGIELLIVVIIILGVLLVFKIPSFNFSTNTDFPINAQASDIQMARAIYAIKGTVRSLQPQANGSYAIVFNESPRDTIVVASSSQVSIQGKPKELVGIDSLQPGDSIIMYANYDLKSKKWSAETSVKYIPTRTNLVPSKDQAK